MSEDQLTALVNQPARPDSVITTVPTVENMHVLPDGRVIATLHTEGVSAIAEFVEVDGEY